MMLELKVFQVDSFTNKLFCGNPAFVVPLEKWLPDELLLNIAKGNNLPETAFFIPIKNGYHVRWFTPEIEMDLCGHATLATAHVIKTHLGRNDSNILFRSKSGNLNVSNKGTSYTLDFPSRMPIAAKLPDAIKNGLGTMPKEVLKSRDYILVYDTEEEIRNMVANRQILDGINLDPGGIVITAKGIDVDFVSRYFITQSSIFEDPVTGSSHCSLIPFWSERLKKKSLTALQLSERGGRIICEDRNDRVFLTGEAITYLQGTIRIPEPSYITGN